MNLGLENKVALITGASAGLGFATAQVLHEEGATIAICSSNKDNIESAALRINPDSDRVTPFVCDLTQAGEIEKLTDKTINKLGRIDVLVTNCGGPPTGTHETLTENDWLLGYNKTFMSTVRLINAVLPGMKERKHGRVILITSFAAKQPVPNLMLSNSYRSGLLGFAKTISQELGPFGVTINTVLPGFTKTERLNHLADANAAASGQTVDEIYSGWLESVPVGRLGRPEELGALIAFLASDKAGYITGTSTAIDGGRLESIF